MCVQQGIGVIDSGVGGLTVVKEVLRQLPREQILYFGDTARCPYGPRPTEEVKEFTKQMIEYLQHFPMKALVIACNTATSVVLQEVVQQSPIPVLGVIEPGARTAIKETRNGNIGVIGTVGTINSGSYERVLKRIDPRLLVQSFACPDLVPLVESGDLNSERALQVVKESLTPLRQEVDTLILGCTHYPLISHLIRQAVGDQVSLISSADETARELSAMLSHRKMLANGEDYRSPQHQFFTSGDPRLFKKIADQWLETDIDVQHVKLG